MKLAAVLLVCVILTPSLSQADVPRIVNYQGYLTDPQLAPLDSTFSMTFSVFPDSSGGTALWSETQASVTVANGLFEVRLGSNTPFTDPAIFDGSVRWLQITIGSETLSPRKPILSTPYAIQDASGWTDGGSCVRLATRTNFLAIGRSSCDAAYKVEIADTTGGSGQVLLELNNYGQGFTLSCDRYSASANRPLADFSARNPSDSQPVVRIRSGGTGDPLNVWADLGSEVPLFHVKDSGNVGIGTSSPMAKLHIAGTPGVDGIKLPDGTLLTSASGVQSGWSDDGSVVRLTTTGDNVGIGTTTPSTKLDVVGTVNTSNLTEGGSNTLTNDITGNAATASNADMVDGIHCTTATELEFVTGQILPISTSGRFYVESSNSSNLIHVWQKGSGTGIYVRDGGIRSLDPGGTGVEGSADFQGVVGHGTDTAFSQGKGILASGTLYAAHFNDPPGAEKGDVYIQGNLTVTGSKTGYVSDICKLVGPPAEQGEIVHIIGAAAPALLGDIPVPLVEVCGEAQCEHVLGIVDQGVVTETMLIDPITGERSADGSGISEVIISYVPADRSDAQYISVVTHGSFARIRADASFGEIRPGDPLTSSGQAGIAMKASSARPGTIIGKALASLASGSGEIPVLVLID